MIKKANLIEMLLQFFVCKIDAELLETVFFRTCISRETVGHISSTITLFPFPFGLENGVALHSCYGLSICDI